LAQQELEEELSRNKLIKEKLNDQDNLINTLQDEKEIQAVEIKKLKALLEELKHLQNDWNSQKDKLIKQFSYVQQELEKELSRNKLLKEKLNDQDNLINTLQDEKEIQTVEIKKLKARIEELEHLQNDWNSQRDK